MSESEPKEVCAVHETLVAELREANAQLREILRRLGKGDVTFATVSLRVTALEKLVYGSLAVALLSLGSAICALVVNH